MTGPLHTAPPLVAGVPLAEARLALVLVHGRGASAESIAGLAPEIVPPDLAPHTAVLAPRADGGPFGGTWYPNSFLAPLAANEPWLSAAVAAVERALDAVEAAGLPPERTVLGGFSQGACLALETAARRGAPLGAVLAFSGGLIGTADLGGVPPDDKAFDYPHRLDGLPVLIAGAERDAHIPLARMQRSAEVLAALGARVDLRARPGSAHTITAGEADAGRRLVAQAGGGA